VSEVTCDSADGDPDVDEPSEPTPRPADPCADITSATECCDAGCHVVRGYAGEGVASCVSPANNCFQERDACHADEVCMVYRTSGDGGCSYGYDEGHVGICVARHPL
jgi:hypothetical protein